MGNTLRKTRVNGVSKSVRTVQNNKKSNKVNNRGANNTSRGNSTNRGNSISRGNSTNRGNIHVITVSEKPQYVPKRVVLLDLDDTLLFKRDIVGQINLHLQRERKGLTKPGETPSVTLDKVIPRPDLLFDDTLLYKRPHLTEALDILTAKVGKINLHIFSASSNPEFWIKAIGLRHYFTRIFNREFTEFKLRNGYPDIRKNLDKIRGVLNLDDRDILYIVDDHPEWIQSANPNNHIIAIKPFTPPYNLYGVVNITYPDYDSTVDDTELLRISNAIKP